MKNAMEMCNFADIKDKLFSELNDKIRGLAPDRRVTSQSSKVKAMDSEIYLSKLLREKIKQLPSNMKKEIVNDISSGCTPILLACKKGLVKVVDFLCKHCEPDLEVKCSPDNRFMMNFGNATALFCAAFGGHKDIVSVLLNHGANIHAVSDTMTTVFSAACFGLYGIDVVKYLLENGADIKDRTFNGKTCLMIAVRHVKLCKFLISKGADVNAKDFDGKTALHHAVECSEYLDEDTLPTVKLLISHGADPFTKCAHEDDVLQAACLAGAGLIFDYLVANLDISAYRKADGYELLGCTHLDYEGNEEKTGELWRIAVSLRQSSSNPKKLLKLTRTYRFTKEFETVAELENILTIPSDMRMQSFLIRHRILGPTHHGYLVSNYMYSINRHNAAEQSKTIIPLWLYWMEIKISTNTLMDDAVLNLAKEILRIPLIEVVNLLKDEVKEILRFEDLFSAMKLIGDQISSCQKLLSIKPYYDRQQENFDTSLIILLHFLYVALEVFGDEENIKQMENYFSGILKILPRTLGKDRSLLHLSVTTCQIDAITRDYRSLRLDYVRPTEEYDAIYQIYGTRLIQPDRDVRVPLYEIFVGIHMPFPDYNVIKFLLECGAPVNASSSTDKVSPLYLASQQAFFKREIWQLLLDHSGHLDQRTIAGDTPCDVMRKRLKNDLGLMDITLPFVSLQCLAARTIKRLNLKLNYAKIPQKIIDYIEYH